MKKILYISNSDRHIRLCHIPYLRMFQKNGYVVHVATNTSDKINYCDKKINIKLKRNPFHISNFFAFFRLRKIIKTEKYDLISCHTPVGGFLGRCSAIGIKKKPKIIYTAHGFHFYKGAPLINWILYYHLEKFLSFFTDAIITMNEEDYQIASKKFRCDVYKINGIGLDENRLKTTSIHYRKKLNLKNKYVVTYIAEISKRKNQLAFLKIIKKYSIDRDIIFLLIGDCNIKHFLKTVKKYKNVKYIDFVENVGDYIKMSDLMIFPSIQEGLPQSLLEAMYFNKMIVATNIRGNRDLIHENNGILVDDLDQMVLKICELKHKKPIIIRNNIEKYKIEVVMNEYKKILNRYLENQII